VDQHKPPENPKPPTGPPPKPEDAKQHYERLALGDWPRADFMSIPVSEFERLCQEIRDLNARLENSIEIVCTGKTTVAILSGDPDAVRAVKLLKQAVLDGLTVFAGTKWAQTYANLGGSENG
jgi:hypothetical protein